MITNNLGQYFTKNIMLKEKIYEMILNNPDNILEPSIGRGDLVEFIISKNPNIIFDMYEIDKSISLLKSIPTNNIIYEDFLKQNITKLYKTIIGNPPFVKIKKGNLYIEFIKKCYKLLDNNGELIFIVPSIFFKLTSSTTILNQMMSNGTFTHIFHPNNEKLFDNASIDIIIFRYCKNNTLEKKILYNNVIKYITNVNGLLTFNEHLNNNEIRLFKDYFDIFVGLVSGKDDIFKNKELGNIELINGKDKINKFIYINKFPCDNNYINLYLLNHKQELLQRKIRKFDENNWFEWGAPRNISLIEQNIGKDCIYIYNITRQKDVSFIGKIAYFGGSLIMLKPKYIFNLENVVSYLNSEIFKQNFMFSGRFKISHRNISNSVIPLNCL
jgi:adenine-specific DNA-methyltransferase